MEVANLCADAVACEGLFDLVGDVTVNVAEPKQEEDQQQNQNDTGGDDACGDKSMTSGEATPTFRGARLFFYTHNLQSTRATQGKI